jgi:Flp pilus assembly pilin Flp
MSMVYGAARVLDYLRNEQAGVSMEYALILASMLLLAVPGITHYDDGIRRLFGFIGSLIR